LYAENVDHTTFILVRHAEKDSISNDPNLLITGKKRAQLLANLLSDVPLKAVYSSDYNRTKQTAQPTADQKDLAITIYNPRELSACANEILSKHKNDIVLVVGHSNSTPTFVNTLLGEDKVTKIDEADYNNIFIVKASALGNAEYTHFQFGN